MPAAAVADIAAAEVAGEAGGRSRVELRAACGPEMGPQMNANERRSRQTQEGNGQRQGAEGREDR